MELELNEWVEASDVMREVLLKCMNEGRKARRSLFHIFLLLPIAVMPTMLFVLTLTSDPPPSADNVVAFVIALIVVYGLIAIAIYAFRADRKKVQAVQVCRTVALGKESYSRESRSSATGYRIFIPFEAKPPHERYIAQLDIQYGNKPAWDCMYDAYHKIHSGDEILLVCLVYKGEAQTRKRAYLLSDIVTALKSVRGV